MRRGQEGYRRPSKRVGQTAMPRSEFELRANANAAQDMRALEKVERPSVMPPAAHLTFDQLQKIQEWSELRLNLAQIGVLLQIEHETWREIVRCNPAVKACAEMGHAQAVRSHAERFREAALVDGDAGALKHWLTLHGGAQWAPKPVKVAVSEDLPAGVLGVDVDVYESVGNALDRQRQLIEAGVIEGEGEEG